MTEQAITHLCADYILTRAKQLCNIKVHVLNVFIVVSPARVKLMIPDLLSVYMKNKLSKPANMCSNFANRLA